MISAITAEPAEQRNSVVKPILSIRYNPNAGAQEVANAVAIPNMPMPSAKRCFGMISVAMVLVDVLEKAKEAPCAILKMNTRKSAGIHIYPIGISINPQIPTTKIAFRFPLSSIQPINGLQRTAINENKVAASPASASFPPRLCM
jgi:hypothetical protein